MTKTLIVVLSLIFGAQSWAGTGSYSELNMDKFSNFLRDNINSAESALNENLLEGESDEMNYFRRFMVRLKGRFGIEVPWIASFTINPEVELVFIREYPEGWETYKP
ncbi:MAG: hypothetical protein SGJ18_07280 [Pseudomonadota bacterium]|nr:hypothetical protein [Pseudomonadota bacterium]